MGYYTTEALVWIAQNSIAIISVATVFISLAAVLISFITWRSQVKYNKNSVMPILNIIVGDYENDIFVKLVNNGVGPAKIDKLTCTHGGTSSSCLINLFPPEGITLEINQTIKCVVPVTAWREFVENLDGRTISPGGMIMLLELADAEKKQITAVRALLKDTCVTVKYTNIYGDKMTPESRMLDWFGRTISDLINF